MNYRIHTDAVKENLIPPELTPEQIAYTYASEADLLNVALFGQTAKQWENNNPSKKGNVRDDANLNQKDLYCLEIWQLSRWIHYPASIYQRFLHSLEAQKTKMKAVCDYNEYEIASEYEDAGKSGKSIEFKLPIIEKEFTLSLDNNAQNETVILLYRYRV